jgi:acyl-CoA synthetase (AMP-forming)/AMP-acid ligase II
LGRIVGHQFGYLAMAHLHLPSLLSERADSHPEKTAYIFLGNGETESGRLTYGELERQARVIAGALRQHRSKGERALLLYPPGIEFIAAFFGCLYAGIIAVPFYPPRPRERASKIRAIAEDAGAAFLLTTSALLQGLRNRTAEATELEALIWMATDEVSRIGEPLENGLMEVRDTDLAFLQYTSGSTGAPKGVMVSHKNLMHNERMIEESFRHTSDSVVVGWLPFFHDMGLIGNMLQPLYLGSIGIFMSPMSFLQKPVRWLRAISNYRATTSGGPNFSFDLCVTKITPEQCEGLDLSSWDLAFNGSEPVRRETMDRFASTFAPYGFRREAFYPCYGLAEATLLVTGGVKADAPKAVSVGNAELQRGCVAIVAAGEGSSSSFVSCGHPSRDLEVVIVDPETATRCPKDGIGEIWVRGPTVTPGYWGKTGLTQETFSACLVDTLEGPFLRTGDLGFLEDGELYVTGRIKDIVIIRGRKHYPQDIELTVEQSHPDLKPDGGAVFVTEADGEASLVVAHEIRKERLRELNEKEIFGNVLEAVAAQHGLKVEAVVLLTPGGILRTSSGKVRRSACRQAFLDGSLVEGSVAVFGGLSGGPPSPM